MNVQYIWKVHKDGSWERCVLDNVDMFGVWHVTGYTLNKYSGKPRAIEGAVLI